MHFTKPLADCSVHLFEIKPACFAAEFSLVGFEDCILLGFNNRQIPLTRKVCDEARVAFKSELDLIYISERGKETFFLISDLTSSTVLLFSSLSANQILLWPIPLFSPLGICSSLCSTGRSTALSEGAMT